MYALGFLRATAAAFGTPAQKDPSGLSQQGAPTAVPLDHPHAALTPPTVGIYSSTPQDGPAAPTTRARLHLSGDQHAAAHLGRLHGEARRGGWWTSMSQMTAAS